jgi:hypothetical protein
MINRLLHDLGRGGYIEVSRGRIVLLKKLPSPPPRATARGEQSRELNVAEGSTAASQASDCLA